MPGLVFVGLGLGPGDLTIAARKAIQEADVVVAEFYTSHLVGLPKAALGEHIGREVEVLERADVEEGATKLLERATTQTVAFLTAGDPMTATTHVELREQALERGVPTRVVHGVSILSAAGGACGLSSYKFGRTVTLVAPVGDYLPESPFDEIEGNLERGLHSLVLLDLRAEEEYYMRTHEAADLLLHIASGRKEARLGPQTVAVALARLGSSDAAMVAGTLADLRQTDLGAPLHTLVVPGRLHFAEEKALERLRRAPAAV